MAETTLPSFAPGTLKARIDDPTLAAAVAAALRRADEERWSERLHDRDTTLWSSDAAVGEKIANRLGWLDLPVDFSEQIPALEAFGEAIRNAGFTTAIVAGMGGSSLAPEVIATAFGDLEDWLSIRVLDSTDPAAVQAAWEGLDPLSTLFIVGSKSGTTTETLAFQADAWQRLHEALRAHGVRTESPGEFMVAVTDPGKSLHAIPHQDEMRGVFLNPESVGVATPRSATSASCRPPWRAWISTRSSRPPSPCTPAARPPTPPPTPASPSAPPSARSPRPAATS